MFQLFRLFGFYPGITFSPDDTSGSGPAPAPATPPGQQSGESGSTAQNPTPSPTGTAPGQQAGNNNEGDSEADLPKTKEALDQRVAKAKRSGTRELLTTLGFSSLDTPDGLEKAQSELRGLLDYAKQQKLSQLTAEERVKVQLEEANTRVQTAETQLETLRQERDQAVRERDEARRGLITHVRNAAILKAAERAKHPQDVVAWTEREKPDLLAKVLKDDHTVDEEIIKQIVAECMKERRDWFGGGHPGVPSNAGAQPPKGDLTKLEKQRNIARQNARSALR